MLFAVQAKLKGAAKIWNDGLTEIFTTWETFNNRLENDFRCHQDDADIHMRMMVNSRHAGEGMEDYIYRMCAEGRSGGLQDSSIIKYIRNGLNHSNLQNAIASTHFDTINELLSTVQRYFAN